MIVTAAKIVGVGLSFGLACRAVGLPIPAPPTLIGAVGVVAVTAGYLAGGLIAEALR